MAHTEDGEPLNRRSLEELLRGHSSDIRDEEVTVDLEQLAADLDRAADSVADTAGYVGECTLEVPYAEIYAVGTAQGGPLEYRCTHDPFHTFSG